MFVCAKLRLHLIQWLRLNFTSARLILTANKTPNKATTKNINFASAQHWYRNDTLGKNTISKMTERVSITAELLERYTNHCIRASTVTSLFQHGMDAKKKKYVQSQSTKVNGTLSTTSARQQAHKKRESSVLSDTFQPQLAVQQEPSGIMKQM